MGTRSFLKTVIKGQTGFSLTEVMVGGAILAGVGLAGAMLFKDQRTAQKKVDLDQNLAIFHQTLTKTMTNTQNCNATLQGFYNSLIPANTPLELYTCSANCGTTDLKTDANGVVRSASPLYPAFEGGRWIDRTKTWRINSIMIPRGDDKSTTGSLFLKVEYEMNPNIGSKKVNKQIILNTRFHGGAFKECFSPQESSLNNLQNDICSSMTSITSSGSVVAQWNPETQTCDFKGSTGAPLKECPAGTTIEGVRADGSVHCKSPAEGFNAAPAVDSSVANCNPPRRAMLRWNETTKKMSIQCI